MRSTGGRISRLSPTWNCKLVYVCLCNALTDRQVKQAAETTGTNRPSDIYAACGCRAQCGQCVKALVNLLRGDDGPFPAAQGAD